MKFQEVLEKRYSVRSYKSTPVEQEKIQAILESSRLAPTAKNSQPQKLFLANTEEALLKVDLVTPNRFGAPAVIILCGDTERACILKSNGRNFLETDMSIVQTYMMLKATELGLGTCWIGRFDAEKFYQTFNVDRRYVPLGILLIGYKSDDSVPGPNHDKRLDLSEVVEVL